MVEETLQSIHVHNIIDFITICLNSSFGIILMCFFVPFSFVPVELVVASLPDLYVERALEFVSKQVSASHHIEFYLNWSRHLLTIHAQKEGVFKQQSLISMQDSLNRKYEALSKICDFNKYTLKVLREMAQNN